RHAAAQVTQGPEGEHRVRQAGAGADQERPGDRQDHGDGSRRRADGGAARRRCRGHSARSVWPDGGGRRQHDLGQAPSVASRRDARRGRFITVEGGEGAGKSTQVELLLAALAQTGIDALRTREPGGSEGAEAIRRLLLEGSDKRWDAGAEALLLYAARRDHVVRLIEPALARS